MKETATLFLYLQSMLGKPNLIRKTSKKLLLFKIIYFLLIRFFIYLSYLKQEEPSEISSEEIFDNVILPVELKARILSLVKISKSVNFKTIGDLLGSMKILFYYAYHMVL